MAGDNVRPSADSGVRLADLVGAFSLATDLGLGQPMDHVLRSWRIAAALGEHLGVEPDGRAALYYVVTLAWVGCVADTPEVAALFGDDIAFRADSYDVDFAGLPMLGFMLSHVGAGSPALRRIRLGASLALTGGKAVQRGLMSHCLTTSRMAERFELGEDVCVPLHQVFARWDGKGVPRDVGGEQIALPMRLFHLADTVEVHHRTRGVDAAVEVARAKRGKHFDPAVVDEFCALARDVLGGPRRRARLVGAHRHRAVAATPSHRGPARPCPRSDRRLHRPAFRVASRALTSRRRARRPRRDRTRAPRGRHRRRPACRAGPRPRPPRHPRDHPRQARTAHRGGAGATPDAPVLHGADVGSTGRARPHRRHRLAHPRARRRLWLPPRSHRNLDPRHRPAARGGLRVPGHDRTARPPPRPHRQAGLRRAAHRRARRAPRRRSRRRRARRGGPATRQAPHRSRGPHAPRDRSADPDRPRRLDPPGGATAGHHPKTAGTHIERIYAKTGATTRSTATLFALQHGLLGTLEPLDL